MHTARDKLVDGLHIVWTIASKDIVDSLKNKLIISLILGTSFMLLMPKVLPLLLDSPYTPVLVFDPSSSRLVAELENSPQFQVQRASSISKLEQVVGSTGFGLGVELGLAVPADFDQVLESGEQPEIAGYVAWANRTKATELKSDFERLITELLGQPVRINIEGNIVYPPSDMGLMPGILTITLVTMIITMGITLVPNLLFEEKQTKTLEALLVSPATVGQVVMGKALVGLFYILVTAGVVFAVYWIGVVHWEVAILFMIGIGLFAVAVGLVLGTFFEHQQDVTGWTMLLIVVFTGAMFVDMVGLQLPAFIQALIPWVPSVALAEVFRFSFSESAPRAQVWSNLGIVLGTSLLVYAVVVWKVSRSDR